MQKQKKNLKWCIFALHCDFVPFIIGCNIVTALEIGSYNLEEGTYMRVLFRLVQK